MEPEPVQPGMLINVCKYLDSLQYRVWKKMLTSVESGGYRHLVLIMSWLSAPASQRFTLQFFQADPPLLTKYLAV